MTDADSIMFPCVGPASPGRRASHQVPEAVEWGPVSVPVEGAPGASPGGRAWRRGPVRDDDDDDDHLYDADLLADAARARCGTWRAAALELAMVVARGNRWRAAGFIGAARAAGRRWGIRRPWGWRRVAALVAARVITADLVDAALLVLADRTPTDGPAALPSSPQKGPSRLARRVRR